VKVKSRTDLTSKISILTGSARGIGGLSFLRMTGDLMRARLFATYRLETGLDRPNHPDEMAKQETPDQVDMDRGLSS